MVDGLVSEHKAEYLETKKRLIHFSRSTKDIEFDQALKTGAELLDLKQKLTHGEFEKEKKRIFPRSPRNARDFMSFAVVMRQAEREHGPGATANFRRHGQSIWYRLGTDSFPPEKRTEIIRKVVRGELDTKEAIKSAIAGPPDVEKLLAPITAMYRETVARHGLDPLEFATAVAEAVMAEARKKSD